MRDEKKDNKSGIWGHLGRTDERRGGAGGRQHGISSCPALSLFHVDFTSLGGGYLFFSSSIVKVLLRLPLLLAHLGGLGDDDGCVMDG